MCNVFSPLHSMTEEQKSLHWLSSILDILLKECPWDSRQTIDSLRYLTVEEVYELSESIIAGNRDETRKELGDIFMHLLFYAKLAEKEGSFTTADVLDGICRKLIKRHPHISLPDRDGQRQPPQTHDTPRWEEVKMTEGRHSALEGVPASLPPLVKAVRMQEKAAGLGFDFASNDDAHHKFEEEYAEFQAALKESSRRHAEEELGDMLFALVKWAASEGINADDALCRTNNKFKQRFEHVEQRAHEQHRNINDLTQEEMLRYWNEAKEHPET